MNLLFSDVWYLPLVFIISFFCIFYIQIPIPLKSIFISSWKQCVCECWPPAAPVGTSSRPTNNFTPVMSCCNILFQQKTQQIMEVLQVQIHCDFTLLTRVWFCDCVATADSFQTHTKQFAMFQPCFSDILRKIMLSCWNGYKCIKSIESAHAVKAPHWAAFNRV